MIATCREPGYWCGVMEPIINLDDPARKIVGKRRVPEPMAVTPGQIEASKAWRRSMGGIRVPKGVFRFHSHEEADEWLMANLTRAPKS